MKTIKNEIANWLILAVPIIYLALVYPALPEIVPTRFKGNGIPNDYVHKTLLLWLIPAFTIGIYLLLYIIPKITWKGKDQTPVNIIRGIMNLVDCIIAVVIIYLVKPNADLQLGTEIIFILTWVLIPLLIILYIIFLIKTRSKTETAPTGESIDSYKWGIFYYNPGNLKIWVPRRYGMGWTLNMAHPVSYLIFAVIIAIIIASFIFVPKH